MIRDVEYYDQYSGYFSSTGKIFGFLVASLEALGIFMNFRKVLTF